MGVRDANASGVGVKKYVLRPEIRSENDRMYVSVCKRKYVFVKGLCIDVREDVSLCLCGCARSKRKWYRSERRMSRFVSVRESVRTKREREKNINC